MTNFEKYKEELLSFIRNHRSTPARIDGTFVSCDSQLCKNCEYDGTGDCFIALIEWLYENDAKIDIDTMSCHSCKYINKTIDEYPCSECRRSYEDKFEPKPKKTRRDEFLEHYPDANVFKISPCSLDKENFRKNFRDYCSKYNDCSDCINIYWSQEVEK